MARIYDLVQCPSCNGKKTINEGQVMKDAKVYQIMKICPKCKGHGLVGKERIEEEEDKESCS